MGREGGGPTLSHYPLLEHIPKDWEKWDPSIKRARTLSESLFSSWDDALLFRTLATLRLDVPVFENVDELRWQGPRQDFHEVCQQMKANNLPKRVLAAKAKQSSGGRGTKNGRTFRLTGNILPGL